MAKPLIPAEAIYRRALEILDADGAEGLTIRGLAADLGISTRTLYQQVESRPALIRELVTTHFARLAPDFDETEDWIDSVVQWSMSLHEALIEHPHLTALMTVEDRGAVVTYAHRLESILRAQGISRQASADFVHALTNVTINHSVMAVRASDDSSMSAAPDDRRRIDQTFPTMIRWMAIGFAEGRVSGGRGVARPGSGERAVG